MYTPSSGAVVYSHLTTSFTVTAAAPSFTLSSPASGSFAAGQTISVQWTAANVPSGSTISLAYDTTTQLGQPEVDRDRRGQRGQRQRLLQLEHGGPGGRDLLHRRLHVHAVVRPRGLLAPHDLVHRDRRAAPASRFPARPPAAYTAGQTISVQWTDANVPSGSTISLAYDTTSNWGNPTVDRDRRGQRGQRQRLLQLEHGGPGGRDLLHRRLHVHAVVRRRGLLAPHDLVHRDRIVVQRNHGFSGNGELDSSPRFTTRPCSNSSGRKRGRSNVACRVSNFGLNVPSESRL